MASNELLFGCTHCHKRYKFEELSSSQHLCKTCRKKYPLVTCTYCRIEFHPIKSSVNKDERPACEHCARDFRQHGTPSFCSICNLQSAFSGKTCSRCTHSEKKYGPPVACETCKLVCAFQKSDEAKRKVDGKTLCLLCTINYRKAQFKKKSHEHQKVQKSHSHHHHHSRVKQRERERDEEPGGAKKMRLEKSSSPSEVPSSSSLLTLGRSDPQPMEIMSSNHVLETNKLQNEISSLKKLLAQKEQALLEKDKLICTLRAESLEKEKDLRQKLSVQQKNHVDVMESLQIEVRNLKKQASQKSSSKGSSAAQSSSAMSVLASMSSSLSVPT